MNIETILFTIVSYNTWHMLGAQQTLLEYINDYNEMQSVSDKLWIK
jgi:hypothetical protein